jgi:hypothetical protein
MPHPGHTIPRVLFIRQKCGTCGMNGTSNKTNSVEISIAA